MTIEELAEEYEHQYNVIMAKIESLTPLLRVYRGEDLLRLRKKLVIYEDMANSCKTTSDLLRNYYKKED